MPPPPLEGSPTLPGAASPTPLATATASATVAPPTSTPAATATRAASPTAVPSTPAPAPTPRPTEPAFRPPPVTWTDDFLGVAVDPRYAKSVWGTGSIAVARGGATGGMLVLGTTAAGAGVARLRLGEDPKTGMFDVQNFSAAKNVVLEVRARFNSVDAAAYTVGFVGPGDPAHVLAAIFNSSVNREWTFQANNDSTRTYASPRTHWVHRPDAWHTFRLVTEAGPPAKATLLIDGVARATVTGAAIPAAGLIPELQVWNKQTGNTWSQATLLVDYLHVQQDR